MGTSNYSATSNNEVVTLAVDGWAVGLPHLVQRRGKWAGPHLLAVPSTASVPITVLLYNGSFLYGFNVPTES